MTSLGGGIALGNVSAVLQGFCCHCAAEAGGAEEKVAKSPCWLV
jgi:hypothetical protein